ncbi:MAG: SAM-dependent methyltransferase, partial [Muribaculaceae bacterium]|nr:SAM-dependent methyltransferase [Muribaculaceae bacterium]
MNTTKLKRFATEARNKLRQGVEKRFAMLGFNDAGVPTESPKLVSGGAVWKDKPCTVAFYNGFRSLEEQIRRYGVSHVVEEAAYTWFNRLMAIRILTMNELCEPVLSYVGSTRTPLIVDEARQGHIPAMDEEDREALMKLLDDDTKTPEQFAMLISAFCHNTPLIAKCFGLQSDYTDVLFPANILSENGFIDMLNTSDFITEEDYHSSELLGWLYQFYISEKKDQVFAKKGKYDADDIPAATQIFTPNWIVKYMVQNAIGGVLGGKDKLPENQRKYYVDTLEPPTAICHDIEELKVADLACGSGHILNECFDLLYDLYISEGYTRREAIE